MANAPITKLEKLAWDYAKAKHEGQVRKFTGQPYFDAHVQKVNGTCKLYTTNVVVLVAALLHDVIEDCFENKWEGYAEIKEIFGKEIADIVLELTSDTDEIKHKWGGSKMDYLIYKMTHMSENALTVKLSDRFNNIADAFTASERFRNNYYRETCAIVDAVEKLDLNKEQKQLLTDIKAKLENVRRIFKIKKFTEFKK